MMRVNLCCKQCYSRCLPFMDACVDDNGATTTFLASGTAKFDAGSKQSGKPRFCVCSAAYVQADYVAGLMQPSEPSLSKVWAAIVYLEG